MSNIITRGLGKLQSLLTRGLAGSQKTTTTSLSRPVFSWSGVYQEQTISYDLEVPLKVKEKYSFNVEQLLKNSYQTTLAIKIILKGSSKNDYELLIRKNPEKLLRIIDF